MRPAKCAEKSARLKGWSKVYTGVAKGGGRSGELSLPQAAVNLFGEIDMALHCSPRHGKMTSK